MTQHKPIIKALRSFFIAMQKWENTALHQCERLDRLAEGEKDVSEQTRSLVRRNKLRLIAIKKKYCFSNDMVVIHRPIQDPVEYALDRERIRAISSNDKLSATVFTKDKTHNTEFMYLMTKYGSKWKIESRKVRTGKGKWRKTYI